MKNSILGKLLIISMFLSVGNYAFAHDFEVDGIYYGLSIFNKNTAYVTHQGKNYNDYNEYSGSVVIPESVTYKGKTYAVQSIGGYAFYGCNGLTSVTIPKSVNTINQNAFNGCTGLKSIVCNATTPPSLLENAFTSYSGISLKVPVESESAYKSTAGWNQFMINIYAVSGLNYKIINATSAEVTFGTAKYSGDLTIPEQISIEGKTYAVTSIGENAFNGCTGLNSIVIPKSITNIASNAFINCTGLKTIIYNAVACSSNVSGIFSSCTSLTKLVIGESVSDLSAALFSGCKSLTTVEFNATNCSAVGENTFASCGSLTKLIIGEKVKSLPNGAFKSCTALTTVEFNAIQCTSIGNGSHPAFEGCTKLTTLTFGAKVITIPEFAFNKSSALKSISIPNSVTSIGRYAFGECAAVTSLTIGNSLTTIPEGTFSGCAALTSVVIPNSVKTIENYAFYSCTGLKTLTIGNAVTSIGEYAFASCKALTSVVLPNSVKTLGNYAFAWTSGLTSVTFGSSVANIGNYAFSEATALTSVTSLNPTPPVCGTDVFMRVSTSTIPLVMPAGSESLYKAAATWKNFKYKATVGDTVEVSGLNYKIISASTVEVVAGTTKYSGNITIPAEVTIDGTKYSVTGIADSAFLQCADLKNITIPNTVTYIKNNAFGSCSSLLQVNIFDLKAWCNIDFESFTANPLYYANNLYLNGSLITSLEIPSTITQIKNYTFYNCTGLKSITIPPYVTRIGDNAFYSCSNISSVTIPSSVTLIGNNAFYSCSGMTSLSLGSSVTSIGNNAFYYCSALTSVTSLNPTPPTCGTGVFNGVNVANIPLTVPSGSKSQYKAATIWKDFMYKATVGETVEVSGLNYKIISASTVVVVAGTTKYSGNITIPASVTIDGTIYSVTQIGENAFYICRDLTSVIIPNSVMSIGDYAFSSCTGLTSVTSLNPTPPTCGTGVFGAVNVADISLTVPSGSESLYKAAATWKEFKFEQSDESTESSMFTYSIVSSSTVTVGATSLCQGDIEIPSETIISGKNYTVVGIRTSGFMNCTNLTSVTIPSSVTSIGNKAFYGCENLTSINIPSTVTSIGSEAFSDCYKLSLITLPPITTLNNNTFYNCQILSTIAIPNTVTSIGDFAFANCRGLLSIEIPNSVTSIGMSAFLNCDGMTSVAISSSVKSIGSSAFNNCRNLSKVEITDLADWCGISFSDISANPFFCAKNLYLKGELISNLEIPNYVTEIKPYTFYNLDSITSVTIPNSVTCIGNYAFATCEGLTGVTIGNSVASIGDYAFSSCTGLKSVTSLNPTPPTCGTGVFGGVNVENITLEVPSESVSLYQSADIWKTFGKVTGIVVDEPELPEDTSGLSYNILNSTDVEVVAGTEKYTGDIVIPSTTVIDGTTYNVTQIGERAFSGCSGLTSIEIPNSVNSIGYFSLSGCTGLVSVTFPNSVTKIESYAFSGCSGLTSITIPNSVRTIGEFVFQNCTGLISVEIPNSVTYINSHPFIGCYSLTSIVVESGNTKYDSRDNCNAIIETSTNTLISGCKSTVIPNSVSSIGHNAFRNCVGLTNITIPNSVTSIGYYAFLGCTGLTNITIPISVTSIGDSAFEGCSGLTSVTSLNPTPPVCGTNVFSGVNVANIPLTVPSGSESLYQSVDVWKDFGTITGIKEESGVITDPVITKLWTIPADASTGLCSVRTGNGFGDTFFGSNYLEGVIEEWKDGQLVASYDINKFCADNQLGEMVQISDGTGNVTEKFQSYVLWTGIMVDDAGNVLASVGTGVGSVVTCQNYVLLPVEDRTKMQLLHIDEFPSADVTLGRVDVPSRIIGNITDGGAYLYITPNQSAIMPVMFIGLNDEGQIFYDNELSWALMSSVAFDVSTNVATFQTFDDLVNATSEDEFAANTYVRWRGQGNPFTWNVETTQFEKNTAIPQGSGTPGVDVFEIAGVKYMVLPIKNSSGYRCSSVGVYDLATGTLIATWDSGATIDYYIGSVQARVNADGRSANIYVCGHKDCFGILRFGSASSVSSLGENSLNSGAGSSAIEEVTSAETDGEVEYYNLQGVRVMNPERGLYIKRQGGKTSKVVL